MDISGRIVVVTGGARGIGLATARHFAAAGARVVLADLDGAAANAAAQSLTGDVRARQLDVRQLDAFRDLVASIEHEVAPIDVLVNNAGVMSVGSFLDEKEDVSQRQFDINVHGVANGLRAVLPAMLARKRGHIINIASVAGVLGTPYVAMYSATKYAVVGLTEAVRREHLNSGVYFSYVCPALVDTELTSGTGRPAWPPLVRPDDVAEAVARCVRTRAVRAFVPEATRAASILPALLPRSVYEALGRWFHLDRMFAQVDHTNRDDYRRRSGVN